MTISYTQEKLKGITNRTQQGRTQPPSHLVNEEFVETLLIPTQQINSPKSFPMTTPYNKINTPFLPTTIKSTVKPSVAPNHSEIDFTLA